MLRALFGQSPLCLSLFRPFFPPFLSMPAFVYMSSRQSVVFGLFALSLTLCVFCVRPCLVLACLCLHKSALSLTYIDTKRCDANPKYDMHAHTSVHKLCLLVCLNVPCCSVGERWIVKKTVGCFIFSAERVMCVSRLFRECQIEFGSMVQWTVINEPPLSKSCHPTKCQRNAFFLQESEAVVLPKIA